MSRLFKGIASAYGAHQTQPRRVRRYQERTVSVDFKGALAADENILSVTWECTSPWITYLSDADATQSSVSVKVRFNYSGIGDLKATVETDAGNHMNYEFCFTVTDAPLYPSATYSTANGPYSVSATAPVEAPGEEE